MREAAGRFRIVALGLAAGAALIFFTSASAETDCRTQTMVPTDVRIVPPSADVPPAIARFSGAWNGPWKDAVNDGVLCHTLVVEEVLANGFARVVYSHGTYDGWKIYQADHWRATGRITDGVLRFQIQNLGRPNFTYKFVGDTLAETLRGQRSATLTRVPNVDQVGCRPRDAASPPPPASGARDQVTADDLLAPTYRGNGPVHNDYFMPVGPSAPARHVFRGALTLAGGPLFRANRGCLGLPTAEPGLTVSFITHGEHLVPTIRDVLGPPGAVIIGPGRVWSEPGDRGMSRASFPFTAIVAPYSNEAHNGLATFLYDDTRVSSVRVQIVQETAGWAQFDFWGQTPATYVPGPVVDEDAVRAAFVTELKAETPIRRWSALPGSAGTKAFEQFDGDAAPANISANGMVVDGAIYLRGCNTRFGPYPYCRHMRHGAFSVTKSLAGAVALLRLAQKYGDDVFDLKIKDYVTVTAVHDGWENVTFRDALNMATGIGDRSPQREPNDPFADELRPKMGKWASLPTAKERLELGFTYGKYAWGPGTVFRYNSTHTFVLSAAMDSFLKRREGPAAHLWDMVTKEVFVPIGILHAPKMHTIEADGSRGIPLLGYGMFLTIDDVAKLTTLFQNGGRHGGQPLLSATGVATALYRTNAMGLPIGPRNRFGDSRYLMSFWSEAYRTAKGCTYQIPYMSGLGGNLVVLMPNGISAFRFADGFNYDVDSMILAAEAVRPFCTTPPREIAQAVARAPMTASELRSELSGNTFDLGASHIFFAPGGRLFGASNDDMDVGSWEVTPDGRYCRTWNVRDGARRRCYIVYRAGEVFELMLEDRFTKFVLKRRLGNPEGY
jgi:hypothetical protein